MTRTQAIVVCAVLGAAAGLLEPTIQDAVQVAQVQSGVIAYAPTDPFYVLCMRMWSLQNEIPALLLRAGVSALALSIALSTMLGAMSGLAVGVCALAAGARPAHACAAAAMTLAVRSIPGMLTYPIWLIGSNYTWGAIGLGWVVSAMGLLALGYRRTGAALLGLGLGVHVLLASAGIAAMALGAAWRADIRRAWAPTIRWWIFGVAAALLSFAVHTWRIPPVSLADHAEGPMLARAVLDHWDVHRQATPFTNVRWLIALVCVAIAAITAARSKTEDAGASALARGIAIIAALGLVLHALHGAFPRLLPTVVLAAMPARLVNFSVIAAPGFAAGVVSRYASAWTTRLSWSGGRRLLNYAAAAAAVAALGTIAAPARDYWAELADYTTSPFWRTVHNSARTLLVGAGIGDMQLVAGRPTLLEPTWIDVLPYVPDAAAGINRALIDVYGVDLLHPPANSLTGAGELPSDAGRALWAARTPDEWRVVGARWGFTHVIVLTDWTLQLPVVAAGEECRLYAITPQ